jgi:hypothetical protein
MINWKFYLAILIFIELIYRLMIFYNNRLDTESFYITLINCPKEYIRLKYHLGLKPMMKFYNWYKIINRCRIIELSFYLSSIIRSIDILLIIGFLMNIIC